MMGKRKPPLSSNGKGASCAYCERILHSTKSRSRLAATRDHVKPASLGGGHKVWCCWACNQIKKDMTPREWFEYRSKNPNWWESAPAKNSRIGRYIPKRGFVFFSEEA